MADHRTFADDCKFHSDAKSIMYNIPDEHLKQAGPHGKSRGEHHVKHGSSPFIHPEEPTKNSRPNSFTSKGKQEVQDKVGHSHIDSDVYAANHASTMEAQTRRRLYNAMGSGNILAHQAGITKH